jgi:hypothetical protein
MEDIRWEDQDFSEVVAPQKEEEEEGGGGGEEEEEEEGERPDDVKSDITRMKITNWKDCIRDRTEWKTFVEKAKTSLKL